MLPDRILIAPGGRHLMLAGCPPRVRVAISDEPEVSGHRPSIDVLFRRRRRVYQSAVVGILMTGMGRDGVEGCKAILAAGGFTLGQDEATSVVYGMNKAAFLEGADQGPVRPRRAARHPPGTSPASAPGLEGQLALRRGPSRARMITTWARTKCPAAPHDGTESALVGIARGAPARSHNRGPDRIVSPKYR